MRYDNWDIILFPEDSNIPIQEYKTACFLSRDEDGQELPTLRTYIGSLKPDKPFRISVHHWGPPRPSPLIQETQRRDGKTIVFTVQVNIEGADVYHGIFEANTASPQEIAYEQRSLKSSKHKEHPSSQPQQPLRFPRSNNLALLQSSAWQPRGTDNRIKVILSERLVSKETELNTGVAIDIVCFSFQHAAREDLLEQAGIAYPIFDPLRSFIANQTRIMPQCLSQSSTGRESRRDVRVQSELSQNRNLQLNRPANPEPHQRPVTRVPSASSLSNPHLMRKGGAHPGIWYDPYGSFGDPDDDISMATWSSRQFGSNMSGTDCFFDPSFPPYMVSPWQQNIALADQRIGSTSNSNRRPKDKSARQVTMALRDDQFGQILEAISPSKKYSSFSHGAQDFRSTDAQSHHPPKMGALSVPVRPSSATIARRTSRSDLNSAPRTSSKQTPSDEPVLGPNGPPNTKLQPAHHLNSKKANHDGPQSSKHATYSFVDRMPTPNPFICETQRWDSDVSMRDSSSNLSETSRFERNSAILGNKTGSAHVPLVAENVKSRKEGLAADIGTLLDIEIRHDQSLLPNSIANPMTKANATVDDPDRTPRNKPNENLSSMFASVEVIDVDAADTSLDVTTADFAKLSPFKPSHKSGMSSISSTGRLERQLYSALGEELGSFEQHMDTADLGPETAQALSGASDHTNLGGDTVLSSSSCGFGQAKRKRKATLGGERDKSPSKKKERARKELVEDDDIPADMPRLRGD